MIHRASSSNAFEFVRVAALRSAQLMRGCRPRVPASHRSVLTAQLEVVAGQVQADVRVMDLIGPVSPRPEHAPVPRGR